MSAKRLSLPTVSILSSFPVLQPGHKSTADVALHGVRFRVGLEKAKSYSFLEVNWRTNVSVFLSWLHSEMRLGGFVQSLGRPKNINWVSLSFRNICLVYVITYPRPLHHPRSLRDCITVQNVTLFLFFCFIRLLAMHVLSPISSCRA